MFLMFALFVTYLTKSEYYADIYNKENAFNYCMHRSIGVDNYDRSFETYDETQHSEQVHGAGAAGVYAMLRDTGLSKYDVDPHCAAKVCETIFNHDHHYCECMYLGDDHFNSKATKITSRRKPCWKLPNFDFASVSGYMTWINLIFITAGWWHSLWLLFLHYIKNNGDILMKEYLQYKQDEVKDDSNMFDEHAMKVTNFEMARCDYHDDASDSRNNKSDERHNDDMVKSSNNMKFLMTRSGLMTKITHFLLLFHLFLLRFSRL